MSYSELAHLGVKFRPIDQWPGKPTAKRRPSPFNSKLSSTIDALARELYSIEARQVIVQVALGESDIRIDGFPKSGRNASHPGVVLAFESKFGPLKFAVDTFYGWEENLRAIALGMEALRKVDRYGVTKRGEQYTGWKELPASTDAADSLTTSEQAKRFLEQWDGDVKRALMETHPDRNRDADTSDQFRRVMKAKELLGL